MPFLAGKVFSVLEMSKDSSRFVNALVTFEAQFATDFDPICDQRTAAPTKEFLLIDLVPGLAVEHFLPV